MTGGRSSNQEQKMDRSCVVHCSFSFLLLLLLSFLAP